MYFFFKKGKQHLDLRGDLVLSHNNALVKARVKSAAPRIVQNATYVLNIGRLGWYRKIKATGAAIRFIWGDDTSLRSTTIEVEKL
jgi:hypothetical protein